MYRKEITFSISNPKVTELSSVWNDLPIKTLKKILKSSLTKEV